MADAGKIMIVPKGAYDASVSYEILDLVTHNDIVWVAKKDVTGVEPSDANAEYWFKMVDDNVSKLGGKGASEYALGKNVTIVTEFPSGITNNSTMKELISALPDNSIFMQSTHKPIVPNDYSSLLVFKCNGNYAFAYAFCQLDSNEYVGRLDGGANWSGWFENATTADLANYLPKSGGAIGVGNTTIPFGVKGADGSSFINYLNHDDTFLGFLGMNGANKPSYMTADRSTSYDLLHTGNKPSGSYTGNGSATSRTIATGGMGNAVIIYGTTSTGNATAILTWGGGIGEHNGTVTGIMSLNGRIIDGGIVIATDSHLLNENGKTYHYQVL